MNNMLTGLILGVMLVANVAVVDAAGKYAIKQMTPEVQSALDHRRERFEQLDALKSSGAIGENNKGYVEVLDNQGDAKALAAAENKDRKVIYQTIAEQNGLQDAVGTIESVFGQVQFDKASSGQKVQNEDGQWITK